MYSTNHPQLKRNMRVTHEELVHSLTGNTEVPWCHVDTRVLMP